MGRCSSRSQTRSLRSRRENKAPTQQSRPDSVTLNLTSSHGRQSVAHQGVWWWNQNTWNSVSRRRQKKTTENKHKQFISGDEKEETDDTNLLCFGWQPQNEMFFNWKKWKHCSPCRKRELLSAKVRKRKWSNVELILSSIRWLAWSGINSRNNPNPVTGVAP